MSELFEALGPFLDRASNLRAASWLIEDLVPDAGRVLIVAAPSAGKTFLALLIAARATAAKRPAFLVLEEGSVRRTSDRFRALRFDATAPVHLAHLRGVKLGDPEVTRSLVSKLRSHDAPVLVLDPFASIHHGDENETASMNSARVHLDELASANPNALVIVTHHTSKAGEREGGMHASRGSGVLSAWADVQINLKHDPAPKGSGRVAFTTLVTKARDGERDHAMKVRIDLGSGEATFARLPGPKVAKRRPENGGALL